MERSTLDSILASWGYGPALSQALSSLARPDLAPARVLSDLGPRLEVIDEAGVPRLAQLSGRLRHTLPARERPVVGDWLAIAAPADPDEPAVVHHVLPRTTQLIRRAAGRADREQVVAANVDTCLIVASANRDASARRLERYLTAVWDSGAAPVVVVSKIDLVDGRELADVLAALAAVAPGVPIIPVSAHGGAGLSALAVHLRPGRTVALIGSSGVGKSSLVNRWLGRDHQAVLPIDANDRGRHATTRPRGASCSPCPAAAWSSTRRACGRSACSTPTPAWVTRSPTSPSSRRAAGSATAGTRASRAARSTPRSMPASSLPTGGTACTSSGASSPPPSFAAIRSPPASSARG